MLRLTYNTVHFFLNGSLRHRMVNAIAVFRQAVNVISVGLLIIANMELVNPSEEVLETVAGITVFALLVFGETFRMSSSRTFENLVLGTSGGMYCTCLFNAHLVLFELSTVTSGPEGLRINENKPVPTTCRSA